MTSDVAPCVIAVLLALNVVFSRVVVKDEPVLTTPSNDDTDVECTIKSSDHLNELRLLDAENASLVFVSWDYAKKACKKDKSVTCQSRCRQNQDGTIALELDLAVVGEKESRTINCSAHFFKDGQSGVLSSSLTVSGRAKGEPRKNTCDESYEDGRKDGLSGALEWALPVIGLLLIVLVLAVLYMRKCETFREKVQKLARWCRAKLNTGTTDDIADSEITEGNSSLAQSNHTQSTPDMSSVQLRGPTQDTTGSGCAKGGCSAHVEEVPAPDDLPTPNTGDVSLNSKRPTSSAESTDSAPLGPVLCSPLDKGEDHAVGGPGAKGPGVRLRHRISDSSEENADERV